MINVMYTRMQPLVMWPSRESLRKTMPMEFRSIFRTKVAVIIDCFEVFMDRPSNLLAQAQTWSSYKHHNTVKFVIGCCPQGAISFISRQTFNWKLWSTQQFKLLPGDIVLADWGFDIQESVGMLCAEVKIPAFTKGKSQLSASDVQTTRKLAHLRIHIERVIGVVHHKYTILESQVPTDYLLSNDSETETLMDKIAFTCCSLTICVNQVPFQ